MQNMTQVLGQSEIFRNLLIEVEICSNFQLYIDFKNTPYYKLIM